MRPTKLTTRILSVFRNVLDDEMNVLMCTDWDLCHMLNKKLKPTERISYRTFQRYKREAMVAGYMNEEDDKEEWEEYDPVYSKLFELFADALINQKKALGYKMLNEEKNWRRYQWILERKFMEWNLRWSSAETKREQKYLDGVDEQAEEKAEMEYRERRWNQERLEREEKQEPINWDEEPENAKGIMKEEEPEPEVNTAQVAQLSEEEQVTANPEPAPEPEPEKPLPYWKQPGYEPDPNRFRYY